MEAQHIILLKRIRKYTDFSTEVQQLMNEYIEISQTGDHFSYDCMGNFKNKKDVFLHLYNENSTFKQFVNRKELRTMRFLTNTCSLYEFNNNFIKEIDIENYPKIWGMYCLSCVIRGYRLNYIFYKAFSGKLKDTVLYSGCNANNYVVYLEELQKHKNINTQLKKYINENLNNKLCDFNNLLKILPDDKKDYWKNYIFLQKLKG